MNIEELYSIYLRHPLVSTDTRKIQNDSIFFALKGANFNGNTFAPQAIEQGASYAVVDDQSFSDKGPAYIVVDDVLETLQKLANHHRRQLDIPVIGITGTNGKTTSKELVSAVLAEKYKVLFTQGNLNNHIGVPLTLLGLNSSHEIAVIEMGANHIGEIDVLSRIAEPGFGLITNIGRAHLEGFGSPQGVIKAKSELYRFIKESKGVLFVNGDNDLLMSLSEGIKRITYGQGKNAKVKGQFLKSDPFVHFKWIGMDDKEYFTSTKLIGAYNIENLLAACAIGRKFGVSDEKISKALSEYTPSNNRSQVLKTASNTLIMDAYNANPTSMEAALKSFSEMEHNNKWVILGDMLELGKDSENEHKKVINSLKKKEINNVVLIGPEFKKASEGSFNVYASTEEAKSFLSEKKLNDAMVLLKGSRGMKLETLAELL